MLGLRIVALVGVLLAPAFGFTGGKVDVDVPELKEKADEVVEVNLEGASLEQGSRLLAIRQGVSSSLKSLLNGLKGIYRRTYRLPIGSFLDEDVEKIRQKMTSEGWSPMLDVRDRQKNESVTVYSYVDGESVEGVTVVSSGSNEVTVVNIVGAVDLDALIELSEEMGLSSIPVSASQLDGDKVSLPTPKPKR